MRPPRDRAVVRVDASPTIGFGHLSRCLAVAAGLRARGWSVDFVTRKPSADKVRDAEFGIRLLDETPASSDDERAVVASLVRALGARLIVVDHYDIDGAYHAALRATGARLVVIDDLGRPGLGADILVNQNIYASEGLYPGARACRLLLGPRFALLRPEFVASRQRSSSERRSVPTVLVTLGGGETSEMARVVVEGLSRLGDAIGIVVVLGPGAADAGRLQAAPARLRVVRDPGDMAALMERCDLAICGGGATCLELACVGVPALVIVMADNQRRNAEGLAAAGITVSLGEHAAVTPAAVETAVACLLHDADRRRRMADRGQALVDGRGVERVVAEIEQR